MPHVQPLAHSTVQGFGGVSNLNNGKDGIGKVWEKKGTE